MADEENSGPSLELPSFRLRRRKRPERVPPPDSGNRGPLPPSPGGPLSEPRIDDTLATPATTASQDPTAPDFTPIGKAMPTPITPTQPIAEQSDAEQPRERSRFELPHLGGLPSALVTGALIGILTVGATWLSLSACDAAKGVSSCGGPGLLILLAILVAMTYLGALLLKAWRVESAGSTSFLAVALLAVVAMLFLTDALLNWSMILVIPVIAMVTFALSHWVTSNFTEPGERLR